MNPASRFSAVVSLALLLAGCAAPVEPSARVGVYRRNIESELVEVRGEFDTPPCPLIPPDASISCYYRPTPMNRLRERGEVLLVCDITGEGRVENLKISHASSEYLANTILQGFPKVPFTPAKIHGIAVRCSVDYRIRFCEDPN